jgi:hemoglobin
MLLLLAALLQEVPPGEEPVAPYTQSDANAGAGPFTGTGMLKAFRGREGIARIVDDTIDRALVDKRLADVLKGQDIVRLRRLLKEQFCYILNGGCAYTGRAMRDGHKNLGLQNADMGALVEDLQAAMRKEGVPFFAQNRFLAKLAPMRRDVVER